ncbi:MAG: hypothetical protein ACTSXC_00175, partial [Candidatus Freyarchaeota archaeon]
RAAPEDEKEKEIARKALEKEFEEYRERLGKALDILLEERIEKLSDDEIKHIIRKTKEEYPKEPPGGRRGENELWALEPLANELDMEKRTFQCYFRPRRRCCMTRYDYLRICDALELCPSDRRRATVERERLLTALIEAEANEREKRFKEHIMEDEQLEAHWSQLPPGTRCVFHKKDLQLLKEAALKLCDGNDQKLVRRLQEAGLEHATCQVIKVTQRVTVDVEVVQALIGVIIDRPLWEISELIQNEELAEEFTNAMHQKGLITEESRKWAENPPPDVVREVSLKSLAEQQGREIETVEEALEFLQELTEQGTLDKNFFVNLPQEEIDKLRENIDKARKKEASGKELGKYTADELNKYLQEDEKISKKQARATLGEKGRTHLRRYLILCKTLHLKPNLNLHYRTSIKTRYPLRKTSQIDFPTPAQYTDPNGETVTITEEKDSFHVLVGNKKLKAEKWKTRYGGKWWGLTIIHYITEEGVYTVVKETGQLWPPHLKPWYTYPANTVSVRFKTHQPLQNLIQTIQKQTHLSTYTLGETAGIDGSTLKSLKDEKRKTISLDILLVLLSLESILTQTDLNTEIHQLEKHITKVGPTTINEDRRHNTLYINLKTPQGAALIGHELGDGNLNHQGTTTWFGYVNTQREYTEGVAALLQHYGSTTSIGTRESKENRKKKYHISTRGLIAYALWCATPQAAGNKTTNNPKVPEWITDNPTLAESFLKAIIKDEAHIKPDSKAMSISITVDVTEKLVEKELLQTVQSIVNKKLKKLREKWAQEKTPVKEQIKEEKKVRRVTPTQVRKEAGGEAVSEAEKVPCNILLGVKKALQTLEIQPEEEKLEAFRVTKTGKIKAQWRLALKTKHTKEVYQQDMLSGYKKKNYERIYRRMRRNVRLDGKLPETHLAELRRAGQKFREQKYTTLTKVLNELPPNTSKEIEELISKHPPKQIEEKKKQLEKMGTKTKEPKISIYFRKRDGGISTQWVLEWFEPPESQEQEEPENEGDRENG